MTVLAIPVAIYPTDRQASNVNYSFKNLIYVVHALFVPLFLLTHVGYNKNKCHMFYVMPIILSSDHLCVVLFWWEACGRATYQWPPCGCMWTCYLPVATLWVAPPWRTDAAGMQFKSPWLTHTITEHVWESHWPYLSASMKWVLVPSALSFPGWSLLGNKQQYQENLK
jgi:hypothetical protein